MRSIPYLLFFLNLTSALSKLDTVYEWKYIDYLWNSPEQKESYSRSGDYRFENIVPIDVDVARDGRVFVTAIRNTGVPASLAVVSDRSGPSGPLLRPYPDWTWFERGNCEAITSVYRIAIDECDKLYVLDTGYIGDNYTCPAQVLIFDLATDRLVDRIKIADDVARNATGVGKLVTPVIETEGPDCELQNLFMADANGRGLVIWNRSRLFRLEARLFHPEESLTNVSIAGESFQLADSLMGMAVTVPTSGGSGTRELMLRPFASRALYAADTRVLARSVHGDAVAFRHNHDMLPSQATAMGASTQGVLFFGLTGETAVGCWNRFRDMSRRHVSVVAEDGDRLQFASGLKVLAESRTGRSEEVWLLSNRLQKIMAGTMNFSETNFRVLKGSVAALIQGSTCEMPRNAIR